jgi:6-phosphogluconolactonase (cycloisomerase 2 family)
MPTSSRIRSRAPRRGRGSVDALRSTARTLVLLVLAAAPLAAAAAAPGVHPLPGRLGCLSQGGADGCGPGRALGRASWVAVSADGRNAYVGAQDSTAVDAFAVGRRTGALAQLPGPAGCVAQGGAEGCAAGRALGIARPVTVSPDGRNVYAGTLFGLAAFARDRTTGALRQLAGRAGCVVEAVREGCAAGRGVAGTRAVAVSRDGRFVYVAGSLSDAVSVFARLPGTGALRQLPGAAGCVSERARPGCARGRGLRLARNVALSPDQRFVYVTAAGSDAVAAFARSPRTGRLRQLRGRAGCLQAGRLDGCGRARTLANAHELALSADGRFAYLASTGRNAVAVLRRSPTTGTLAQLPGRRGCIEEGGSADGCMAGRALRGAHSVALTPDGRLLLVAGNTADAIAVFARDPTTGGLRQLPGARGCVGAASGCTPAAGLRGVHELAVSPTGRTAYAASEGSAVVTLALSSAARPG